MRYLYSFPKVVLVISTILQTFVRCQLIIAAGCTNIPGLGDGTAIINDEMFELSRQVAVNARELIRDAVFYPDAMTQADRVRVFEILATLALPVGHSRFREVVDGLMGTLTLMKSTSTSCLEPTLMCMSDRCSEAYQ